MILQSLVDYTNTLNESLFINVMFYDTLRLVIVALESLLPKLIYSSSGELLLVCLLVKMNAMAIESNETPRRRNVLGPHNQNCRHSNFIIIYFVFN